MVGGYTHLEAARTKTKPLRRTSQDSMRILITGGAGCLGSNLTERFLEAGHEVLVLDNFTTGHRGSLPEKHAAHDRGRRLDHRPADGRAAVLAIFGRATSFIRPPPTRTRTIGSRMRASMSKARSM